MLLLGAILVGLLVGWARGGSLLRLATLELRWPWLLGLSLLGQLALFSLPPVAAALGDGYRWLYLGSYLPVLLFLGLNRSLPAWGLLCLGVGSNLLVITLNGGLMPTLRPGAGPGVGAVVRNTAPITDQTLLPFLGDVLLLPLPTGPLAFSLGDVLIALGVCLLVQRAMCRRRRWRRVVS